MLVCNWPRIRHGRLYQSKYRAHLATAPRHLLQVLEYPIMGSLPLPGTFSPELGSRMPNAILTDVQLRSSLFAQGRRRRARERELLLVPASGDGNRRNGRPKLDHWPQGLQCSVVWEISKVVGSCSLESLEKGVVPRIMADKNTNTAGGGLLLGRRVGVLLISSAPSRL